MGYLSILIPCNTGSWSINDCLDKISLVETRKSSLTSPVPVNASIWFVGGCHAFLVGYSGSVFIMGRLRDTNEHVPSVAVVMVVQESKRCCTLHWNGRVAEGRILSPIIAESWLQIFLKGHLFWMFVRIKSEMLRTVSQNTEAILSFNYLSLAESLFWGKVLTFDVELHPSFHTKCL